MKDKMERFAILPFSMGCVSESSVAVGVEQPKSSRTKSSITTKREEEEESPSSIAESMKISSLKFPKPSISKILKSFKSFTQLFVYKEDMEDELEMEMEIGYPTDVKHVTHIGLDGSTSTNPTQGWDSSIAPPRHRHLLSGLDSSGDDPLKQFELSMAAAQASFVPRHHI